MNRHGHNRGLYRLLSFAIFLAFALSSARAADLLIITSYPPSFYEPFQQILPVMRHRQTVLREIGRIVDEPIAGQREAKIEAVGIIDGISENAFRCASLPGADSPQCTLSL